MVWVESPTNPRLQLVDLEAVASVARKHGLVTMLAVLLSCRAAWRVSDRSRGGAIEADMSLVLLETENQACADALDVIARSSNH